MSMETTRLYVGDKVKFREEVQSYTVYAADERYAVCMKPFNAQKTTLYTIVDLERGERGPDNMIFPRAHETAADAERTLRDLQSGEVSVSRRRGIPLDIERVIRP